MTETAASTDTAASILDRLPRGATLTQRVYERLRRGLLVGFWQPGEKLSARSIAREMGVSQTPVREAMMRLANEGALEVTEARAFIIAALSREGYEELIRIRVALEPMAAEIACNRMGAAQIDEIEALNESMAAHLAEEDYGTALEFDSAFHLKIYGEADQPLLLAMIDSLLLRAGPTRTRLSHNYRRSLSGYNQHCRILEALRRGDGPGVRSLVAEDLTKGAAAILAVWPD